ncbi:hypothetical protein DY000_02011485 [Brassica cretica]|uniref:RNase H type-1 domain-containing protein n=1 Tax=Brassica cretica TaxID=69181 RepID=A0ABQ7D537_BRACR|nr:hypothetical protein DY000_02011485 [Brassica cretica]
MKQANIKLKGSFGDNVHSPGYEAPPAKVQYERKPLVVCLRLGLLSVLHSCRISRVTPNHPEEPCLSFRRWPVAPTRSLPPLQPRFHVPLKRACETAPVLIFRSGVRVSSVLSLPREAPIVAFSWASGPLHRLTGGSSSSDLSPSPRRTVTETLSCTLLKIVFSLQQPTSWSPLFPMPTSSLLSSLAVLHIWDMFLPEPPPLPDPPDPPNLASDSDSFTLGAVTSHVSSNISGMVQLKNKVSRGCPVTSTIMVNFTQTFSRQGRERSSSTSSFQERIFSPQFLFVRGNSHPISKTWTIDDAGTSTSHSTTASFVASPLIAETLAMQNAMISAHCCGIKSLSLEALFKKLPVFTYDSNRLTYPFNVLVSFNVQLSEFHSLALSSLLVIFD